MKREIKFKIIFSLVVSFVIWVKLDAGYAEEKTQVLKKATKLNEASNKTEKIVDENSFIKKTRYQVMISTGVGSEKLILDSANSVNDHYGYIGYDLVFQYPYDVKWWPYISLKGSKMFASKKDESSLMLLFSLGVNRIFGDKWIIGPEFGFKRVRFIVHNNNNEERIIRENNFYLSLNLERFIFHKGPYFSLWGIAEMGILFPNNLDFNNKVGNYWMFGFKMRFSMQSHFEQSNDVSAVALVYDEKDRDNYIVSILMERERVYDNNFDDLRYSIALKLGKEF
ncbi:MAG: hypothetical protein HQK49_12115 [Oligoflexia bacterium]|nr:hypothetical protein [Oligoflexia bacterium]